MDNLPLENVGKDVLTYVERRKVVPLREVFGYVRKKHKVSPEYDEALLTYIKNNSEVLIMNKNPDTGEENGVWLVAANPEYMDNMYAAENPTDWVEIGKDVIEFVKPKKAVKIKDVLKYIRSKYSLPESYLSKPYSDSITMNIIKKSLDEAGVAEVIDMTDIHPETKEEAGYLTDGWFYVRERSAARLPTKAERRGAPAPAVAAAPGAPTPTPAAAAPAKAKPTGSSVREPLKPIPSGPVAPSKPWPKALEDLIPKKSNYIARKIKGKNDTDILRGAWANKKNVLLQGPPGGGKTTALENLAFSLKLPYRRVELHGGVEVTDLIGGYVPADPAAIAEAALSPKEKEMAMKTGFMWQDGVLTMMVRHGGIFIADEINAMPRDLAMKLHGLLDRERRLVIPERMGGEIIPAHDLFMFAASMNPDVSGVRPLGEGLKDRFDIVLDYGYDKRIEELLVPDVNLREFAKKMRDGYKKTVYTLISTRMLLQFLDNQEMFGNEIAKQILVNKFDTQDERKTVEETFSMTMGW